MAHLNDEEAYEILAPRVDSAVTRMPTMGFSTKELIEQLRSDQDGEGAYQRALAILHQEGANEHMARMVLHGQIVPGLLRRSPLVRFGGFIHGDPSQDDGFGVPSRWRRDLV